MYLFRPLRQLRQCSTSRDIATGHRVKRNAIFVAHARRTRGLRATRPVIGRIVPVALREAFRASQPLPAGRPCVFGPDPPACRPPMLVAMLVARNASDASDQSIALRSRIRNSNCVYGTRRQKCFGGIWAAECECFGRERVLA